MDARQKFKRGFTRNHVPDWQCPRCGARLILVKESLCSSETVESKRIPRDDVWEPDWITYIFSASFKCVDPQCGEFVATCGKGTVDVRYDEDEDGFPIQNWEDHYYPQHFTPHLQIFDIPNSVPKEVSNELENSFSVFFSDSDASGNHLRCAAENILDYLRVPRARNSKKTRKRSPLYLHNRIEALAGKYSEVKDLLLAIKWLGNAGSHSRSELRKDDILDGYVLFEEVLKLIFFPSEARTIAKVINKNKGPKSRTSQVKKRISRKSD